MGDIEVFLNSNIKKDFADAVFLNDIQSKTDPETEPFLSKYKARNIWNSILKKLLDYGDGQFDDDRIVAMACVVRIKLGVNFTDTEELSSGEEHLNTVVQLLRNRRLETQFCSLLQCALNHLGILHTGRQNNEKALQTLEECSNLYNDYKYSVDESPVAVDEIFLDINSKDNESILRERNIAFEDAYTHTLFYLAQVYRRLGDSEKSAQFCQSTLKRQLKMKRYQAGEWAMNAAALSQYYMVQNQFRLARHCLASAEFILDEMQTKPTSLIVKASSELSEDDAKQQENFIRSWADLYRCWIKYSLALMEFSLKQMYVRELSGGKCKNCNLPALKEEFAHNNDIQNANFCSCALPVLQTSDDAKSELLFELELTKIEDQIACDEIITFEQAREVFLVAQKWVNLAKEYYVLDGHCTDYVAIVQDNSTLFKHLANFEKDFERRSRMHKRRIDMLQPLVDQLNPQFYLLIVRQLVYEIAETYSAMFDAKLSIIERDECMPNTHQQEKINFLILKSIESYEKYLKSLLNTSGKLPEKLPEDDERPALIAYFCMGRLWSKFIEYETRKKLANMNKSLECYKFVSDYCKKNPASAEQVKTEKELCDEMVTLLPVKMEKLLHESQ